MYWEYSQPTIFFLLGLFLVRGAVHNLFLIYTVTAPCQCQRKTGLTRSAPILEMRLQWHLKLHLNPKMIQTFGLRTGTQQPVVLDGTYGYCRECWAWQLELLIWRMWWGVWWWIKLWLDCWTLDSVSPITRYAICKIIFTVYKFSTPPPPQKRAIIYSIKLNHPKRYYLRFKLN